MVTARGCVSRRGYMKVVLTQWGTNRQFAPSSPRVGLLERKTCTSEVFGVEPQPRVLSLLGMGGG